MKAVEKATRELVRERILLQQDADAFIAAPRRARSSSDGSRGALRRRRRTAQMRVSVQSKPSRGDELFAAARDGLLSDAFRDPAQMA